MAESNKRTQSNKRTLELDQEEIDSIDKNRILAPSVKRTRKSPQRFENLKFAPGNKGDGHYMRGQLGKCWKFGKPHNTADADDADLHRKESAQMQDKDFIVDDDDDSEDEDY